MDDDYTASIDVRDISRMPARGTILREELNQMGRAIHNQIRDEGSDNDEIDEDIGVRRRVS